jgi:16S rRNA (adenine1518-N6/adenine1519-N6)-dimethyltransferase
MVQKAVADRLIARPGSRNHGILAVVMGSLFEISLQRTVPATVFWPKPEVASAIVRMLPRESWDIGEYRIFLSTVKAVFLHRRKKLGTTLRRLYALDESQIADLTRMAGCEPDQRPEQLIPEVWRRLAAELSARGLA